MKVGMFDLLRGYGGTIYEDMVERSLLKIFDVKVYPLTIDRKYILPMKRLRQIYRLSKIKESSDIWIRTFLPIVSLNIKKTKGINIALFFHLDNSEYPHFALSKFLENIYFRKLNHADVIVVISQYWKQYLENRGYKNINIIYNGFDLKYFDFDEKELREFRKRFGFVQKPIIYIGNCQIEKGVVETYKSLKDMNVDLVTTGFKNVDLPSRHLNLTYRDYLKLLKVSSAVITMSKFKEGWCRTAHEAMLCKTPVIGSGTGGMAELLEGGSQIICNESYKLPYMLEKAINNSKELGEKGYEYASQFTLNRFESEWVSLVSKTI